MNWTVARTAPWLTAATLLLLHALNWDGRSGAGDTVPAGVYFVRITTAEGTGVARHVVLQ